MPEVKYSAKKRKMSFIITELVGGRKVRRQFARRKLARGVVAAVGKTKFQASSHPVPSAPLSSSASSHPFPPLPIIYPPQCVGGRRPGRHLQHLQTDPASPFLPTQHPLFFRKILSLSLSMSRNRWDPEEEEERGPPRPPPPQSLHGIICCRGCGTRAHHSPDQGRSRKQGKGSRAPQRTCQERVFFAAPTLLGSW